MSDRGRAVIAVAKVIVALLAGGYLGYVWLVLRGASGVDEAMFPEFGWLIPYIAGIITALMIYLLLSRLGKSSAE